MSVVMPKMVKLTISIPENVLDGIEELTDIEALFNELGWGAGDEGTCLDVILEAVKFAAKSKYSDEEET